MCLVQVASEKLWPVSRARATTAWALLLPSRRIFKAGSAFTLPIKACNCALDIECETKKDARNHASMKNNVMKIILIKLKLELLVERIWMQGWAGDTRALQLAQLLKIFAARP